MPQTCDHPFGDLPRPQTARQGRRSTAVLRLRETDDPGDPAHQPNRTTGPKNCRGSTSDAVFDRVIAVDIGF
jgi:hypothetical protein